MLEGERKERKDKMTCRIKEEMDAELRQKVKN